jgi:hypothetical protein
VADDPTRGHSDTLYEEHEPTEKVDKVPFTLYGVPQAAEITGLSRPTVAPRTAQGALPPAPPAAPGAPPAVPGAPPAVPGVLPAMPGPLPPADAERPVFVSMKPPSERSDKTEIVPAIERPDMRPRLRPVTEPPPAWNHPGPGTLGNYAPPRPRGKRSWLWLYVVLTLGAALAGAGVTLWLRSIW